MFQFFKDLSSVFGQEELKKFYILQIYVVLLAFSEFFFIFIIGNLLSWMEEILQPSCTNTINKFLKNKDYAFIGLSISWLFFQVLSLLYQHGNCKFPQKDSTNL